MGIRYIDASLQKSSPLLNTSRIDCCFILPATSCTEWLLINKMVHVRFDTSQVKIDDLINQYGSGHFIGDLYQRGYGRYSQRGAGVGDVLRKMWRFLMPLATRAGQALAPIAKQVGQEIGKEGLLAGSRVLSSVAEGANVRDALVDEGKASVNRLIHRAARQQGSGRIKKRRISDSGISIKPERITGRLCTVAAPPTSKKRRVDALGPY